MREIIEQHFPKYKSDKYGEAYLTEAYKNNKYYGNGLLVLNNEDYCIEVGGNHNYEIEKKIEHIDRIYVEMGWKQFEELFQKVQ